MFMVIQSVAYGSMPHRIRLNRIGEVFDHLEFPSSPTAVAAQCGDIVVELAEGEVSLGTTIRDSTATEFTSAGDLEAEFMSLLPRHAVGEPYQSDGDA